jgi:hypothetical protein
MGIVLRNNGLGGKLRFSGVSSGGFKARYVDSSIVTSSIVTSGLVLSLDAADTNSYISGSSTWRDLTGNGYNFVGSGTYGFSNNSIIFHRNNSTNTGGQFSFSNIPTQLKIENFLANSFTIETWCQPQTLSGSNTDFTEVQQAIIAWPGFHNTMRIGPSNVIFASVWNSIPNNEFIVQTTSSLYFPSTSSYNHMVGVVNRNTTNSYGYLNGTEVLVTGSIPSLPTMTSAQGTPANTINIGTARDSQNYKWFYTGSIAVIKLYNRALSASEIQQNYNAQKSRFGL